MKALAGIIVIIKSRCPNRMEKIALKFGVKNSQKIYFLVVSFYSIKKALIVLFFPPWPFARAFRATSSLPLLFPGFLARHGLYKNSLRRTRRIGERDARDFQNTVSRLAIRQSLLFPSSDSFEGF